MSPSSNSISHNTGSVCGSDNGLQLDYVNASEESSELVESAQGSERRRGLPGLPGGPALDEPDPEISNEVLDALLAGARTAQQIAGPDGVLAQLTRRLLSRALEAKLTEHLGMRPGRRRRAGAAIRAMASRARR